MAKKDPGSKIINQETAKKLIGKYQQNLTKASGKLDAYDHPKSVRIKREDLEEILKDSTTTDVLLYFAVDDLEDKQFLSVVATGLTAEGTATSSPVYAAGSCPCPTVPSCCTGPITLLPR